ncbi:hypothetical protein ABZ348_30310 [Streptomyces sp. NPDC005963]|uniref:hypothetical protein n=1 Tax=Streptomyces sp. NPDC005963 TaxID=3156721 RepID=UPI0033E61243
MGGQVTHKRWTCLCDHEHDTCSVDFLDLPTGTAVHYGNGRRGRTADRDHHQHMTELNAKVFERARPLEARGN